MPQSPLMMLGTVKTLSPLFVVAVATIAVSLGACGARRPSDQEIIAQFKAHRAQIDTLMEMMRTDQVLMRVDDNWTDPADPTTVGISHARIAEYREILETVGWPRGFYYDPKSGCVSFIAWTVGLTGSGASKSVVYMPENPTPLVDDLDAYHPPPGQGYLLAYRHLEGPWYLQIDGN